MKSYEELVKELNSKIPRSEISTRDAGQGRSLDYVSGFYVIKRLNEVLGPGSWAYGAEVSLISSGEVETYRGKAFSTHYMAKVRLVVTIGDKHTEFTDYGYGDGLDAKNQGKSHELAIKESVTDGLKRCAKNLGMSLGLALYDKSQENVEENEKPREEPKPDPTAKSAQELPKKQEPPIQPKIQLSSQNQRDKILKNISLTSKVLIESRRKTQEQVVDILSRYGVKTKEELSEDKAVELLKELEEELKK